jgi:hypothetical protein
MPPYVFVLSLLLLLVACHRDKPARLKIIAPTVAVVRTNSLPEKKTIPNTYANYRQLFTKIDYMEKTRISKHTKGGAYLTFRI